MQGGTLRAFGFRRRRDRHLVTQGLAAALLVAAWFLAATVHAAAQNTTSRDLMAATEQRRNAAFLKILRSTGDPCDRVVQTQYDAFVGDSDDWEAKCNDGGHYAVSISANPNKQARVLNCRELLTVGRLLAGPSDTPSRCRMK
jgi:hypothetical protein